ncbi:MAG: rhomboid family intramembrane serine protease [Verrucomicrobiaceae bacterium]
MSWFAKSKDHLPVTWWKGHPVYFAAVLALAGVVSMIVTTFIMAADAHALSYLYFSWSGLVDHGRVWTIVTYALVNPPSIMVVLSSVMLWRFGEDVEKFFGRRVFTKLIVYLLLAEPLILSFFGVLGLRDWPAAGIFFIEFGVFIAFATLYPRAKLNIIICSIDAWVLATIIVAVSALQSLAGRNWPGLVLLAVQVGLAYAFVRVEQGRVEIPSFGAWFKKQQARRQSSKLLRVVRDGTSEDVSGIGVDAILEKISRQGMNSLTAKERRMLEKASDDLKRSK